MLIYADIVFAVNLIMDAVILLIVSKLAKHRASALRIFFGGLVMSSLYCILIFIAEYRLYLNIFASVVIIMLGIIITFKPRSIKLFLKLVALSHVAAFSLGGTLTALFYYANINDIFGNIYGITKNFSFKLMITSTCVFYIIFKAVHSLFKSSLIKRKAYYRIKIFFRDMGVDIRTLVDTGNSLHDPINNNPVIVVEFNSVKDFLPDSIRLGFYEHKELDFNTLSLFSNDAVFSGRLRLIPFASLGKRHGMLLGFRPDKVEIYDDAQTTVCNDVIIGIYNFKLSSSGDYQGLLSPELITS